MLHVPPLGRVVAYPRPVLLLLYNVQASYKLIFKELTTQCAGYDDQVLLNGTSTR